LRFGQDGGAPFANLRRERPGYYPIGDAYLEMIVAADARNSLAALLCAITVSDMNLLLSFTAWAFHGHHHVPFVRVVGQFEIRQDVITSL
jgi:hypothetical protein